MIIPHNRRLVKHFFIFLRFFWSRRWGRRGIIFPHSPRPIAGIPALPPTRLRGLPNIQVSFGFLLSFDGLIIARLPGNVNTFFQFFSKNILLPFCNLQYRLPSPLPGCGVLPPVIVL